MQFCAIFVKISSNFYHIKQLWNNEQLFGSRLFFLAVTDMFTNVVYKYRNLFQSRFECKSQPSEIKNVFLHNGFN